MSKPELEGFLEKRGEGIGITWKKRFFTLANGNIYYYNLQNESKDYRGFIENILIKCHFVVHC